MMSKRNEKWKNEIRE